MFHRRYHFHLFLVAGAFFAVACGACRQPQPPQPSSEPGPQGSLIAAIMDADFARAELLLAEGADPNQVNRFGDSSLIWAVQRKRPDLAGKLIARGARIDHRGSYGKTALHWACAKGRDQPMYPLLIEAGADMDIRDQMGETPLMAAVRAVDLAALGLLLEHGANAELVNFHGQTALQLAVEKQSRKMVETLLTGGATADEAALRAAVNRNLVALFKSPPIVAVDPQIVARIEALYEVVEVNPEGRRPIDLDVLTRRVHELINQERTKRNVKPLAHDEVLARIAREHSRDMGERSFFDHVNPDREDPTARALKVGYTIRGRIDANTFKQGVGENIHLRKIYSGSHITNDRGKKYVNYHWLSLEELAQAAVTSWMESPPHRENILNPIYEKAGVGIAQTSDDSLYFTQEFW